MQLANVPLQPSGKRQREKKTAAHEGSCLFYVRSKRATQTLAPGCHPQLLLAAGDAVLGVASVL